MHTSAEKRAQLDRAWAEIARSYELNDRQLAVVKALRNRFGGHLFKSHGDVLSRTLHLYGVRYREQEAPYISPFEIMVSCGHQTRHALISRGILEEIDAEYRLSIGALRAVDQDLDDPVISAIIEINQGQLKDEWSAKTGLRKAAGL